MITFSHLGMLGTVQRVPRFQFKRVAETLDVFSLDEKLCSRKSSSVGHAVVMNKKSFIDAGMENENFISWGPEDSERYNRCLKYLSYFQ